MKREGSHDLESRGREGIQREKGGERIQQENTEDRTGGKEERSWESKRAAKSEIQAVGPVITSQRVINKGIIYA